ncbi:hypothetical protein LWC35_37300 [Pseudonocardia kujensis]|uniref:hypothetical protein n=1 Tax=Pseudonocardia kujensis TaxID=1128675 RepID=UPI001E3DB016|nr:hypothetical protein [Pseudonocardia kujensis]MCE0768510.1 hypothetical protein [Pseudonocardia kujensis]
MSTLITVRPGCTLPHPEHRHAWSAGSHHPTSDGPVTYRKCLSCGAWGLFVPTASAEDGC